MRTLEIHYKFFAFCYFRTLENIIFTQKNMAALIYFRTTLSLFADVRLSLRIFQLRYQAADKKVHFWLRGG